MGDKYFPESMPLWQNLKGLIITSRPHIWPVQIVIYAIGVFFSGSGNFFYWPVLVQMAFLTLPFGVILYSTNDVYDFESDIKNPRKKIRTDIVKTVSGRNFIIRSAYVMSILLIASSIPFLMQGNFLNIILMVLAVSISFAYSVPPFRLKEIPVLDSLSNGIATFFMLALGYTAYGNFLAMPIQIYFVGLGAAAIHALGAAIDYEPDKAANIRTIATALGTRTTCTFSSLIFLIMTFFGGFRNPILVGAIIASFVASLVCTILGMKYTKRILTYFIIFCILILMPAYFISLFLI